MKKASSKYVSAFLTQTEINAEIPLVLKLGTKN